MTLWEGFFEGARLCMETARTYRDVGLPKHASEMVKSARWYVRQGRQFRALNR